ncbi:hypothetical protein [Bosea sp. NPDC055594]
MRRHEGANRPLRQIGHAGLVRDSLDGLLHGADPLALVDQQRNRMVRALAVLLEPSLRIFLAPGVEPIGQPLGSHDHRPPLVGLNAAGRIEVYRAGASVVLDDRIKIGDRLRAGPGVERHDSPAQQMLRLDGVDEHCHLLKRRHEAPFLRRGNLQILRDSGSLVDDPGAVRDESAFDGPA